MMVEQFQSTRPGGARRLVLSASVEQSKFQSTRPGGARLTSYARGFMQDMFQSTRPGGARRFARILDSGLCGVSIHAPRRGATFIFYKHRVPHISFNPRAPAGRDLTQAGLRQL